MDLCYIYANASERAGLAVSLFNFSLYFFVALLVLRFALRVSENTQTAR